MRKISMFIVDDDEDVVNALKAVFKPNKRYRVRAHTSAATALQDAEHNPPQLVLCDQMMPDCSGIELLGRLKQRWPGLRSILLTGQSFDDVAITRAMNEGVVDLYISKPYNQVHLEEAVGRLARVVAKNG